MKKILLLGGLRYLIPVINAAHQQGYYVITADYLPDNYAHKFSDEYINISITDQEGVLKEAQKRHINGVISFAVDPGVVTAAYVQEQMNLPVLGPYESVKILQNKDLFRLFLKNNGFNVPNAKSYDSLVEVQNDLKNWNYPVIVKPTDSAGSKGVKRVDKETELITAAENAFANALKGKIIIEDYIEPEGCTSDSDSFSVNGEMKFITFSAQRFDKNATNPYVPSAFSWPSTFTEKQQSYLKSELQRLITLLKMQTTVYNIETRIGKDGKAYIMEVSPRGGGNRLSEMVKLSTGVDFITAAVRAAVGDKVDIKPAPLKGHWAEVILHAHTDGKFEHLIVSQELKQFVQSIDLWAKRGDKINSFIGANASYGTMILKFDTAEQVNDYVNNINNYVQLIVK